MMFHPYPPVFAKHYCFFHGTMLWRIVSRVFNFVVGALWLIVILSLPQDKFYGPIGLLGSVALGAYLWSCIQYDIWVSVSLHEYEVSWSHNCLPTEHCVTCAVHHPPPPPPIEPPTGTT